MLPELGNNEEACLKEDEGLEVYDIHDGLSGSLIKEATQRLIEPSICAIVH